MNVLTSFLESGQYPNLRTKSDITQSLLCGVFVMFSVEQTEKICGIWAPQGPCFSVTKNSDKAALPLLSHPKMHPLYDR